MSSWAGSDTRASAGPGPGSTAAAGGIVMGVIRTGLLVNSAAAGRADVRAALALLPGERVRTSERPIPHAVSPERLVGVDCDLATRSGRQVRAVGTVLARALITGGRVLQGSALTRAGRGSAGYRQPWSYYLSWPGSVETIGKADWADAATGFLTPAAGRRGIDFGAVCDQVMDMVQGSDRFDRRPPFRAARTTVRWVLEKAVAGCDDRVEFVIADQTSRLVRLTLNSPDQAAVAELCEDLALHDWLLTTVTELISRSRLGEGTHVQAVNRVRPAIDHLLHLWMPGVRVTQALKPLWSLLDNKAGFIREWNTSVNRIRDQLAMNTLTLLSTAADCKGGDT
jgi:hypothetical protein